MKELKFIIRPFKNDTQQEILDYLGPDATDEEIHNTVNYTEEIYFDTETNEWILEGYGYDEDLQKLLSYHDILMSELEPVTQE